MKSLDITPSTQLEITRSTRKIKSSIFKSEELNELAEALLELDNQYADFLNRAEKNLNSAFQTRWLYGKYISENYDKIIDECGTQKTFANKIKQSEAVISNNKRAYEFLLKEGCETFDEVKALLRNKEIRPTIRNFEKIGTLLNEPTDKTTQIEQTSKDRRRLEELMDEVGDIVKRNEGGSDVELVSDSLEFLDDIENTIGYLETYDPNKRKFKSEKYLDFVRSYGFDIVTREPCERCDPHHTTPEGGSGSMGDKLPDYFAIPVSRSTHILLERGIIELTKEEILRMHFEVLSTFVYLHLK